MWKIRWGPNNTSPLWMQIFQMCLPNIAASASEPWLPLPSGGSSPKIKAPMMVYFGSILKRIMFDRSPPCLSLYVLCVMIQRQSIGHCILKIRMRILLLGNPVTPINLCLTNPLKIWCSAPQFRAASKDGNRCCYPNTFINYLSSDVYQGPLGQQE